MTRYTDYLKQKVLCKYCNKFISKGQRVPHINRKIHIKNVEYYYKYGDGKIDENSEVHEGKKKI